MTPFSRKNHYQDSPTHKELAMNEMTVTNFPDHTVMNDDDLIEFANEYLDLAIADLPNGCSVDATGYVFDSIRENDNIYSKEYWIEGLIDSHIPDLLIQVGGWFDLDLREEQPSVYFLAVLKINGEILGESEGIQGHYDAENGVWELEWGAY